jgi:hypothetical protein
VANLIHCLVQGICKTAGAVVIALKQMIGYTLCRFWPDTRQTAQRINEMTYQL